MKEHEGKKRKQIVTTNWRYTKEVGPAFQRLMRALLNTNSRSNSRKGGANENSDTVP